MNAVFERDFVRFSCSARFLWIRAGFALAMGALVLWRVFPSYAGAGNFGDVGIHVLYVAVGIGAVTLLLLAPGAFGTVLVHARAQGALPVLLCTPLTPLSVAVGAFSARCGLLVLFILATWPPIALALMFGGVRSEQVLEASASILASTFVVGAPAFMVSAYARRTAGAVVASYLLATAVLAALGVAGDAIATNDPWLAAAISPYHALAASLSAEPIAPGASISPPYVTLAWSTVLAVVAVLVASLRLRREGLGDGDPTVPGTLLRRRPRPLRHDNPILDHELRAGTLGNRQTGARSLLGLLTLTEIGYFVAVHYGQDATSLPLHTGVLSFECLLLVLGVTAAGSTTLATEHETHVLDLLRVTPLTPAQIVIGKLVGLMRSLFPCVVIPVFHVAWAAFAEGVFSPAAVLAFPVCALIAMCTWALAGMVQSLEQTDPRRSIIRTMGLLGIFGVIVAAMIGVPVRSAATIDTYIATTSGFGANPVAYMLLPVAAFRVGGSTLESAALAAPDAAAMSTAAVAGVIWTALHVLVSLALYRRLFVTYRTRFDW